jgi:hypothetical protein
VCAWFAAQPDRPAAVLLLTVKIPAQAAPSQLLLVRWPSRLSQVWVTGVMHMALVSMATAEMPTIFARTPATGLRLILDAIRAAAPANYQNNSQLVIPASLTTNAWTAHVCTMEPRECARPLAVWVWVKDAAITLPLPTPTFTLTCVSPDSFAPTITPIHIIFAWQMPRLPLWGNATTTSSVYKAHRALTTHLTIESAHHGWHLEGPAILRV